MSTLQAVVGQSISHYRILERLGSGGMSVVYKAEDLELGRFVALKFLSEELTNDPQALERFRREARLAAKLNHRNIVPIVSVHDEDGILFFTMKLIDGGSLAQRASQFQDDPRSIARRFKPLSITCVSPVSRGLPGRAGTPRNPSSKLGIALLHR